MKTTKRKSILFLLIFILQFHLSVYGQGQSSETPGELGRTRAAEIIQSTNEAKEDFKAGNIAAGEQKLENIITHPRGTPNWHRNYAHLKARTAVILKEEREKSIADQLANQAIIEFESTLSLLGKEAVEDKLKVLKSLAFLQENYFRNLEAAAAAYSQAVALSPDSRRFSREVDRLQVEIALIKKHQTQVE